MVRQRPLYVSQSIEMAALDLEATASPSTKAVHAVLLPVTPTWDADQRWAIASELAQVAIDSLKPQVS